MTTVSTASPYGRFIEIKSNLRREKLWYNFVGGSFRPKANNKFVSVSPCSEKKFSPGNPEKNL